MRFKITDDTAIELEHVCMIRAVERPGKSQKPTPCVLFELTSGTKLMKFYDTVEERDCVYTQLTNPEPQGEEKKKNARTTRKPNRNQDVPRPDSTV